MNVQLNTAGVLITTDRAESSYGQPVLVIAGIDYGRGDAFGQPLIAAMKSGDDFDVLMDLYDDNGIQALIDITNTDEQRAARNAFLGI